MITTHGHASFRLKNFQSCKRLQNLCFQNGRRYFATRKNSKYTDKENYKCDFQVTKEEKDQTNSMVEVANIKEKC